jgi:hypothetical protein
MMFPDPIQTLMCSLFLIIPIVLAIPEVYLVSIIFFDLIIHGSMKYFNNYYHMQLNDS